MKDYTGCEFRNLSVDHVNGVAILTTFCYKKMYRCFAVKIGRTVMRSSAELEINVQSTRGIFCFTFNMI